MFAGLDALASAGIIHPEWAAALAPVEADLVAVGERLDAEVATGRAFLPAPEHVLRAFSRPPGDVRVLVVGQDPYPTPGHPIGLSFAVDASVRPLPRSLANIFAELSDDVGIPPSVHGNLSAWEDQGVLLLNRVLTVAPGEAGSHRGWGWEAITARAIDALASREEPLVAILWGKDAAALQPRLAQTPAVVSAHPSPLSARRGFFGSKPFSRTNELLVAQGAEPIDWRLPQPGTLFD